MSESAPSQISPLGRAHARASQRGGWLLVALGVLVLLSAGALLALILNWLPLGLILPANLRATGPVRATTAVFVWDAIFLALGAAILALGARRLRRS